MEEDSVKHDDILDFAMYYCLHDGSYPDGLTKEKKRAVHKRAESLSVFYSGAPISLEYFAWGCQKPGKPNSL